MTTLLVVAVAVLLLATLSGQTKLDDARRKNKNLQGQLDALQDERFRWYLDEDGAASLISFITSEQVTLDRRHVNQYSYGERPKYRWCAKALREGAPSDSEMGDTPIKAIENLRLRFRVENKMKELRA